MDIKNSQILLIESSLNELHKLLNDKDIKISQLNKDKDSLKENILNLKYEIESINDDNDKLKKQTKILFDKQNDLKDEIRDKDYELRAMEKSKRDVEKLINSKNESFLNSMEIKLDEANKELKDKNNAIKDLEQRNQHLKTLVDLANDDNEALKYDNDMLQKQLKKSKETIFNLEGKIKDLQIQELQDKKYKSKFEHNDIILDKLAEQLMKSTQAKNDKKEDPNKKEETTKNRSLSEEDIIKNNLGL